MAALHVRFTEVRIYKNKLNSSRKLPSRQPLEFRQKVHGQTREIMKVEMAKKLRNI